MNPFKGSPAFLLAALIPIMLPQVMPEPLRWIWLTLVVLWALKRLGIIKIGLDGGTQSDDTSASSEHDATERSGSAHRGEIVALGSAPYRFDEANSLSYYITLRDGSDDKTLWGVDLKRIALETPLAVGDRVALEFVGRQAVDVEKPVRNDQGRVVGHRKVKTHRHSWRATVLSA